MKTKSTLLVAAILMAAVTQSFAGTVTKPPAQLPPKKEKGFFGRMFSKEDAPSVAKPAPVPAMDKPTPTLKVTAATPPKCTTKRCTQVVERPIYVEPPPKVVYKDVVHRLPQRTIVEERAVYLPEPPPNITVNEFVVQQPQANRTYNRVVFAPAPQPNITERVTVCEQPQQNIYTENVVFAPQQRNVQRREVVYQPAASQESCQQVVMQAPQQRVSYPTQCAHVRQTYCPTTQVVQQRSSCQQPTYYRTPTSSCTTGYSGSYGYQGGSSRSYTGYLGQSGRCYSGQSSLSGNCRPPPKPPRRPPPRRDCDN